MKFPILMYDDLCTSCTKYAMIVNKILKGRITLIGLYSKEGREFRKQIFPQGYQGTDMSWFCKKGLACGGRSGLLHLIKYILFEKKQSGYKANVFNIAKCNTDCGTVKGVMFRSFSIITSSREILLDDIVGEK